MGAGLRPNTTGPPNAQLQNSRVGLVCLLKLNGKPLGNRLVLASSKVTPCLRLFALALLSSHSKAKPMLHHILSRPAPIGPSLRYRLRSVRVNHRERPLGVRTDGD